MQHVAAGRKLRMRVRVQRQRIKIWVSKGRAGSRHSVPFRVVTRMLRIRKRLQQRPIVCMHLGKGSVGIGRPVHTINLTALASGVPIGALQLPSQQDLLEILPFTQRQHCISAITQGGTEGFF